MARHAGCWAFMLAEFPTPAIGAAFGGRDHTTVVNSKKVAQRNKRIRDMGQKIYELARSAPRPKPRSGEAARIAEAQQPRRDYCPMPPTVVIDAKALKPWDTDPAIAAKRAAYVALRG